MCATARIMRSKSARSSRRERQGQAQAHRARPQSEGAGEGAAQDAAAQGAQVRETVSPAGEASGPADGLRLSRGPEDEGGGRGKWDGGTVSAFRVGRGLQDHAT